MATGRLQVRVTTQIILPLENVQILITEADTQLLLEQKTVYTISQANAGFVHKKVLFFPLTGWFGNKA